MKRFTWMMIVLWVVLPTIISFAQQNVIIDTPVSGTLLVASRQNTDFNLLSVDTQTGNANVIAQAIASNRNIEWDPMGQRIVYERVLIDQTILDVTTTQETSTMFSGIESTFWEPVGWTADGSELLYLVSKVDFPSSQLSFYRVNVDTSTPTLVWGFNTSELLPELAPFQELSNYIIADVFYVERNPVYDQWSVIQFRVDEPENVLPTLTLLWNMQSNTFIPVIDPTQEQDIVAFPPVWHDNGTELILMSMDYTRQVYNTVWEFSLDGTVTLKDSIPTERQVLFSLGAGDLLITRDMDDTSMYYLGEIIDGQWFETAFIEFPDPYENITPGDWHISASEAERAQLSCLFDQTLPQRLNTGDRGRIAFTNGTSSRLRDAPSINGIELALMPEGTEFDVIGGSYCKDGYRWLQLQLSDGTTGWSVEATPQEYWLEPLN